MNDFRSLKSAYKVKLVCLSEFPTLNFKLFLDKMQDSFRYKPSNIIKFVIISRLFLKSRRIEFCSCLAMLLHQSFLRIVIKPFNLGPRENL